MRRNLPSELLNLAGFLKQQVDRAAQGPKEFVPVDKSDQHLRRGVLHFLRQEIEATAVVRRQAPSTTREAQGVVSYAADPVFRLPQTVAFDTEPGPQGVVHCVAEQLLRLGRLHVGLLCGLAE